ncbi:MAG: HAMP domain-containing histidine kinase [Deltaproteobacteria bacterium]|nr:HAMP domain-containing histidine kinase [Deltaproteobacteria bacterium]
MGRARLVALPVLFAFMAWLAFTDRTRWRQAFLLVFIPMAAAFVWAEWRRYRREGFTQGTVERNLAVAALGQMVVAGASGGLESPLLPLAVVFSLFVGLFVSRGLSYLLLFGQLAGLWTLAALALAAPVPDLNPAAFGGGPRAGHSQALLWANAILLSFFLAVGRGVGRIIRKMFDAMLRRALAAQEDARTSHAERSEELTALSAEIAHELKNPLASVKGLAGLLEAGVAPGKGAERLGVLRREVDRMQGILDEFLNFSRPLVPLALGRVDLAAVAREVAALHEGLARERGVQIEVRAAAATVRCDPRKVKQLLINLVQNAIEASQAGGSVELETSGGADGAQVRVLDRGRGPDPTLGERLFEAGVTTKPRGSGLGLPIARQLARQHGGDLTLGPRPGGGAVAELRLPLAPPEGQGQPGEAA